MPIDYSRYPPNWKSEIVPRIKRRANDCCEFCGVENHIIGYRNENGKFVSQEENRVTILTEKSRKVGVLIDGRQYTLYSMLPNGFKLIQIVLTVAHLDHDPENWGVADERLKALCQACHLKYDLSRHIRKRKYGAGVYKQPTLFD